MIPLGTIIALDSVEDNQIFIERHAIGKLISIRNGDLVIEKFGRKCEVVLIENWMQKYCQGNLPIKIHSSTEIAMFSKTIVLNRDLLLFGMPTRWQKIIAWINFSKYKPFTSPLGGRYFVLKKKLSGTVFTDGFFIPFGLQWMKTPLYFSKYDKSTILWTNNQKN